jgi:hypothetical protein
MRWKKFGKMRSFYSFHQKKTNEKIIMDDDFLSCFFFQCWEIWQSFSVEITGSIFLEVMEFFTKTSSNFFKPQIFTKLPSNRKITIKQFSIIQFLKKASIILEMMKNERAHHSWPVDNSDGK